MIAINAAIDTLYVRIKTDHYNKNKQHYTLTWNELST